jgi:hypothetical protein
MKIANISLVPRLLLGIAFLSAVSSLVHAQDKDTCSEFQQTIDSTYNFRPALLANEAERNRKSAAMDKVWEGVKGNPTGLLVCLRRALEDPKADAWFRFDGSNLLVSLDDSRTAKELQIKSYAASNLEDVDLRLWVATLARRGVEGFDVSAAGERWLAYPRARYFLPEHGGYEVNVAAGALFIFGSMDETQATPALLRVISQSNHPGREAALAILLNENTRESLSSLKQLDVSSFSAKARNIIRDELDHPNLFQPRSIPKTSRKEFLDAFNAWLNGNPDPFLDLVAKVPDGERDVVATMTAEDLPLVRMVRRRMISVGNQHAIEFYESFTRIIKTIVLKSASTKTN